MALQLSESQKKKILTTIDQDFEIAKAWATYHQTLALTGVTKKRKVFRGTLKDGEKLTDEEKVMDSMNTAKTHIDRMNELLNLKKQIT